MSIILDHQLREKIAHDASAFPISYFQDELALLPNQAGPLHWHPEFEIATAASGVLEYQVGQERITLQPGDSILVGGNMLHSIRQLSGDTPDPMPNIVFFGSLIAPETSTIYTQYIQPIIDDHALPYVVFRHDQSEHAPVNGLIRDIYRCTSAGLQVHFRVGSPKYPQRQGFMAATIMKVQGKVTRPLARVMVTLPSSMGWRRPSVTCLGNSGSSSRKSTPL